MTVIRFLKHGYGTFDSRHGIGPIMLPNHDLLHVHRGQIHLQFKDLDSSVILEKNQGVLIWPNTHFSGHAITKSARVSVQHFSIQRPAFELLHNLENGYTVQSGIASNKMQLRDVDRALMLSYQEQTPSIHLLRTHLLCLILIAGAFHERRGSDSPYRIDPDKLKAWLTQVVAGGVGVPEMASFVGLSASRFRCLFIEEHGYTAGEFIRQFRENESRRLLSEGTETLKGIASALGYSDAVAFHRAFKKRVGMTPAAYRKQNRVLG